MSKKIEKLAKKIMIAVRNELDGRKGLGWEDAVQGDEEMVIEIEQAVEEEIRKVLEASNAK